MGQYNSDDFINKVELIEPNKRILLFCGQRGTRKTTMRKTIIIVLSVFMALNLSFCASDVDIVSEAMDKAIIEQVKYETLNKHQEKRISDLSIEVGTLRLESLIKDVLIVCIAVLRITF